MATTEITRSIDARGMACPGPLMALIGAIRTAQVGDVFEVLSSDEGSKTDIPAWVQKTTVRLGWRSATEPPHTESSSIGNDPTAATVPSRTFEPSQVATAPSSVIVSAPWLLGR